MFMSVNILRFPNQLMYPQFLVCEAQDHFEDRYMAVAAKNKIKDGLFILCNKY